MIELDTYFSVTRQFVHVGSVQIKVNEENLDIKEFRTILDEDKDKIRIVDSEEREWLVFWPDHNSAFFVTADGKLDYWLDSVPDSEMLKEGTYRYTLYFKDGSSITVADDTVGSYWDELESDNLLDPMKYKVVGSSESEDEDEA